jgi:tetratricopeptide (TPR) repeat protein
MMTSQSKKRTGARRRENLLAQLARLENAQFIHHVVEEEPAYLFRHVLLQETACDSLLVKTRREIHLRVAQTIEAVYANRLDENAALLAQHYAEAGDDAKTLDYATRAGDLAARVYANDEALLQYARALGAGARAAATTEQLVHLYTQRGRVLEVTGKFPEALESYKEMAALASERGDRRLELSSLMLRATAHATPVPTFDAKLAQQLLEQALTRAHELGDRAAEAKIFWIWTLLENYKAQPAKAAEYGEQALAIARELIGQGLDMREQLAYILHDLSFAFNMSVGPERGVAMLNEANALWRELGNKPMLVDNLATSALMSFLRGDFPHAMENSAEGMAIAESIDNVFGLGMCLSALINVHTELGEFDRALQLLAEALPIEEQRHVLLPRMLRSVDAWLLGSLGAFDQALQADRRARQVIEQPMPEHFRARAYATLAQADILRGDLAAAQADLAAGYRSYASRAPFSVAQPTLSFGEADLALARGEPARAIELMELTVATLERAGVRIYLVEALYLQGRALEQQGKLDQASQALGRARAEAQSMSMRRMLWQILAALAQIERARGHLVEANALQAQARDVLGFLVEHTPEEYRDAFLNQPTVRVVLNPA